MKLFKNIVLILSILMFYNCANYTQLVETKKTKHISGLASGKSYLDYKIKVDTKKEITFKSIKLNDEIITKNLYLKELSTGLSSTKIATTLNKGAYEIGFRVFNINSFDKVDKITFNYSFKNKDKQLVKTVEKEDKTITNK